MLLEKGAFWCISTALEIFVTNDAQALERLLDRVGPVLDVLGHCAAE